MSALCPVCDEPLYITTTDTHRVIRQGRSALLGSGQTVMVTLHCAAGHTANFDPTEATRFSALQFVTTATADDYSDPPEPEGNTH